MRHYEKGLLCAALCAVIGLSGCGSEKQTMLEKGYPPAYAEGYQDGCDSGKKAGGDMFSQFAKDVNRYDNDKTYHEGWEDGFKQCKSEQLALQKSIDQSIEQQKLYERQRHDKKMEENHMLDGIDTSGLDKLHK